MTTYGKDGPTDDGMRDAIALIRAVDTQPRAAVDIVLNMTADELRDGLIAACALYNAVAFHLFGDESKTFLDYAVNVMNDR